MSIASAMIESRLSLQARIFTAEEIRRIDTESLARFAFESNEHIRKEYSSEESFIAFWSGERRRHRLIEGEATAPMDPQIRQEWDRSPALRDEFRGSFESYKAYLKADRAGRVRIAERKG